jgi:hypothetical protein
LRDNDDDLEALEFSDGDNYDEKKEPEDQVGSWGDGANEIDVIVEDYAKRLGLDEALPIPVREKRKRYGEEEELASKRPDI